MNIRELQLLGQIERGSEGIAQEGIAIKTGVDHARDYLGMSSIGGDACELWLKYHKPEWFTKVEKISGQLQRIFRLGKVVEEEVVTMITRGGGKVQGTQDEVQDFDGKFKGHIDGRWESSHILEIKTMNTSRFQTFETNTVEDAFYLYFCQVQMYMHYTGLHKAMVVAYNKDNSQISCKEVEYDKIKADHSRMKAYAILYSRSPNTIPIVYRNGLSGCGHCEWQLNCLS